MTVDRAALIEAAARALITDVDGPTIRILAEQDARTVLNAILPLIAEAVRAGEYRPDHTNTNYGAGVSMGAMIATDHAVATVQALLGDTDGDR